TVGQLVAGGLVGQSRASISRVRVLGLVVGAWRATTLPCRSTRNLVKFHLMDSPSNPDFSRFRYLKSGCASLPLTSIFSNIGNVTSYVLAQNCWISADDPGSWCPN